MCQLSLSFADNTANVVNEHMMHDTVTDCIRPRITDGASRDSCGDGRVVADM